MESREGACGMDSGQGLLLGAPGETLGHKTLQSWLGSPWNPPKTPCLPWMRAEVAAPSRSICQQVLQRPGSEATRCHSST